MRLSRPAPKPSSSGGEDGENLMGPWVVPWSMTWEFPTNPVKAAFASFQISPCLWFDVVNSSCIAASFSMACSAHPAPVLPLFGQATVHRVVPAGPDSIRNTAGRSGHDDSLNRTFLRHQVSIVPSSSFSTKASSNPGLPLALDLGGAA